MQTPGWLHRLVTLGAVVGIPFIAWRCDRGAATIAGPPTAPSPSADVGTQNANNGTVTVLIPLIHRLSIVVTDPDGIQSVSVFRVTATAVALEASVAPNNCPRTVTVALQPPPNHDEHAHRVIYTDCQGKPAERGRAADTSTTEVWAVPQDPKTNPPTRTESQKDTNPRVADANPGNKTFRALLVGGNFNLEATPCAAGVAALRTRLLTLPNWQAGNITTLTDNAATKAAITTAITAARTASQPGDEFFLYYCDHGLKTRVDAAPVDEVSGGDNVVFVGNASGRGGPPDQLSDDELTVLMSGFRRSVTLTVIIEACFSGGMFDGTADLPNATDATGSRYDKDHLAGIAMARVSECSFGDNSANMLDCLTLVAGTMNTTADVNRDGVTTTEELFRCIARLSISRRARSRPVFFRGAGP